MGNLVQIQSGVNNATVSVSPHLVNGVHSIIEEYKGAFHQLATDVSSRLPGGYGVKLLIENGTVRVVLVSEGDEILYEPSSPEGEFLDQIEECIEVALETDELLRGA